MYGEIVGCMDGHMDGRIDDGGEWRNCWSPAHTEGKLFQPFLVLLSHLLPIASHLRPQETPRRKATSVYARLPVCSLEPRAEP